MAKDRRNEAWAGSIAPVRGGSGSALLSGCITSLNKMRTRPLWLKALVWHIIATWYVLGELEAGKLEKRRVNLSHDALNVHATWRISQRRMASAMFSATLGLAKAEEAYGKGHALPHQLALAYTAMAKVLALELIESEVEFQSPHTLERTYQLMDAIRALIPLIRKETDQPQGLRQLARVLKHLSEVSYMLAWPREHAMYLAQAEAVAHEADTGSQVDQLALMRKKRA